MTTFVLVVFPENASTGKKCLSSQDVSDQRVSDMLEHKGPRSPWLCAVLPGSVCSLLITSEPQYLSTAWTCCYPHVAEKDLRHRGDDAQIFKDV